MKNQLFQSLCFLTALLFCIACGTEKEPLPELTYTGEEPRVQDPLSPEASQKHIQLPDGFEAVLFAAEPDIINPIAFAWDERGRLWVVQSQDYPHDLANDVGGDRITICEDTNGDGRADKFTDFATEQSLSTGITIVKGGAIVAQAPEMVFLEDTNGDDKMDKRTVLFDGFGTWDTHAGPSSLRYGPDNWIWGSVGYSAFAGEFEGKKVDFRMGVYRFSKDGKQFEPVGRFNNNTWGMGITQDFEIFGSTANNNHACYVGIPLKHYEYLGERPEWAINADFIQGHYEITPPDTITPLQQVDVRGGYTAAAGANFYTAENYPKEYQNQMYVNEPTGHVVHLAKIISDGAGYKEEDGGNIFASTDAWTAPVFTETGPDGNLWVADWYNPVIQHNPDKRGMDNQIWNDNKGEGNAHLNPLRDKGHGRIYIIKHKRGSKSDITALSADDPDELLDALESSNMFWRTTAQRLIVENNITSLIPKLIKLAGGKSRGLNGGALHALWALDGLGALDGNNAAATEVVTQALSNSSDAVKRAGLALLPETEASSELLVNSGLLTSDNLHLRLAAALRAGELPETSTLFEAMEAFKANADTAKDKWLTAASKIYFRELGDEQEKETNNTVKADRTIELSTVSQKMAYDKTLLHATAGQTIEIVLTNRDQMPHNMVLIESGSLENFGKLVDEFLQSPDAAAMEYVPKSRYILGATSMLDPEEKGTIRVTLPDEPGDYPFICTFPGHWRMMQGILRVSPKGTYISENPNALNIAVMGGGGSHNFLKFFGGTDAQILSENGRNHVSYTENSAELEASLKDANILVISNNKPFDPSTKEAIFSKVNQGMPMLIYHPSTWYNWKDWPEYNRQLVAGGSRSHEKLQEFEVRVVKPNHPIMQGVPANFRITDELYRWEQDPAGPSIEVLAIGKGLESGKEYPVVWVVKHNKARIIGNTLGHDERAHDLPPYQTILNNSLQWVKKGIGNGQAF